MKHNKHLAQHWFGSSSGSSSTISILTANFTIFRLGSVLIWKSKLL